jgi:hypothetical protein
MMPAGPDVTQFHVGRSIALWVSAFEILTHTGGDKVKLYDVYDRLAAAPWREKQLRHKRHMFYGSKTKRALPCWIYGEIHHARNDFLHGNPIDRKHLIVKRSQRNLFNYAAPLYRMALTGFFLFLSLHQGTRPRFRESASTSSSISMRSRKLFRPYSSRRRNMNKYAKLA